MPISHPHKTIFVHIPKTAGTAVEVVLGMHGGKTDIGVVPYFNQQLDFEHLYGRQMQHMTAEQIKEVLQDDAVFEGYFKFTIVRNPWDRLVSALAWTDQKWARGIELSTEQFDAQLRQIGSAWRAAGGSAPPGVPQYLLPQHDYIFAADGRSLVDFVARYEDLAEDWRWICQRLNLSTPLPVRMKSHHRDYRDYYDGDTRVLVGEMYASDARVLGYEF